MGLGKLLLFGLLVFFIFAVGISLSQASNAYSDFKEGKLGWTDFRVFYSEAQTIVSDQRALTYDEHSREQAILAEVGLQPSQVAKDDEVLFFGYNPPIFFVALSPLTLFDQPTAYLIGIAANCVVAVLLAVYLGKVLRWRQPQSTLLILALLGFAPTAYTIYHGQPTLFIALILLAAFYAAERGRGLLASFLISLATVKPQWVVLVAFAMLRHRPRLLKPLFVFGSLVTFLPFVFLGPGALSDFFELLTSRAGIDLQNASEAARILNWSTFLTAVTGSSQPLATTMASLLTLAVFLVVWRRGDRHLTWAAAIFATAIATPHVSPQDWVITIAAAAILLSRPMSSSSMAVTFALLLVAYLGVNLLTFSQTRPYSQLAVPASFALIVWCAALPYVEERVARTHPVMELQPVVAG
jgi:Glycosyltransferase family 87